MKFTLTLIALGILASFFLAYGYSLRRQYRKYFNKGNDAEKNIEKEFGALKDRIEGIDNQENPKESPIFLDTKFYSYLAFITAGWVFSFLFFLTVLSKFVQ